MEEPDPQKDLSAVRQGDCPVTAVAGFIPVPNPLYIFLLFVLVALAVHHAGFASPMIYDSKAWIADKAQVFASSDPLEVLRIVAVRPLFMLTLYGNYLLAGMEPIYFRVVNAVFLAAASFMLMKLMVLLLQVPGVLTATTSTEKRWISLALALLFLVHPLQSFVVLYIWQREAIMACFFYYSALAMYISIRTNRFRRPALAYFFMGTIFLAGLLSKENLATLPVVLFMAEVVFFSRTITETVRKGLLIVLTTLPAAVFYVVLTANLYDPASVHPPGIIDRLYQHYGDSGLSAFQVMLSESRVLFSYILMILAPMPGNLDLVKAESISRSLVDPAVTLAAVAGVILMFAVAVGLCRKRPLACFGLLFFLVTLAPESLLIPQFLFFGYRPILPMAGLLMVAADVLPVVIECAGRLLPQRSLRPLLAAAVLLSLAWLSFLTCSQARHWNPREFWARAYSRLPRFSGNVERTPYVTVLMSHGSELVNSGRNAEAVDVLGRAVSIGCGNEQPSGNWDKEDMAAGRHDATRSTLKADPCPQMRQDYHTAYTFLGMAMAGQGRLSEAMDFYRAAIKLKPDSADAYSNWGSAELQLGNNPEAVRLLQTALKLQPNHATAANNLGEALLRSGQAEQAIKSFHRALELQPDYAAAFNNLGNAMLGTGKVSEAIALYRKGVEIAPESAQLHNNLAAAYLRVGDLPNARTEFQRAVDLKPNFAKARVNLAIVFLELRDIRSAIDQLDTAIAIDPNLALAYVYRGRAEEMTGDVAQAEAEYSKALEIEPNLVDAHFNLARIMARRNNTTSAIDHYEKVLKINPGHHMAHNDLGTVFLSASQFDKAAEHLRKALEIRPDLHDAQTNLDLALKKMNQAPQVR